MASLYSLPEHLSQRAFRSSSSAVRRAPSALSQITSFCVRAEKMQRNPGINPLACLPAGVRLKTLDLVCVCKGSSLAEILCPRQESTRVRVQDTIGNLEMCHIGLCDEDPVMQEEFCAIGTCLKQMPLRRLVLVDLPSGDVLTLLEAMSEGSVTETLEQLHLRHPERASSDHGSKNAVVAALVPFKRLVHVSLDFMATDNSPLKLLPALKRLDVMGWTGGNLFDDMPCMPQLEVLCTQSLPNWHQGPLLRSESLKELHRELSDLDALDAALECACQGALPCLRVIQVEAMSIMLDSIEIARGAAISFACKLGVPHHVSVNIGYVSDVQNLDAFLEHCLLIPELWSAIQYIYCVNAWESPTTRLHELPRIFLHLEEFNIVDCTSDEILDLCDVLSALGNMRSISVNVCAENWFPGMATSILSLCAQGVLLSGSSRARGLTVSPKVEFGNVEVSEED